METVIAALVAIHTTSGSGSIYRGPIGNPLFCATSSEPLYYDQSSPPWVALPVSQFGVTWERGDLLLIRPQGASSLMARALDAGPFGDHCIQSATACQPIVVDVPAHLATWEGLSAEVEVVNISAVARACKERGMCD